MKETQAKELHFLLFSFMGIFHKKFLQRFRKENPFRPRLKKNQAKVVHILYQFDSLTFTELGKMLDIEKGGLTTIIDQLEGLKVVVRKIDPDDRRRHLLSLSDTGQAGMDLAMGKFTQNLIDAFQNIEQEDEEDFFVSLRHVVGFMSKL